MSCNVRVDDMGDSFILSNVSEIVVYNDKIIFNTGIGPFPRSVDIMSFSKDLAITIK